MRIKKFKDFKKRGRTRIRRVSDAAYNWVPTHNAASPAPATSIPIAKIAKSA